MNHDDYTNLIAYGVIILNIRSHYHTYTDYERKMWSHYDSVLLSVYALIKEYRSNH